MTDTPSTEGLEPERELIARIVDPDAWAHLDAARENLARWSEDAGFMPNLSAQFRREAQWDVDDLMGNCLSSLSKADQIIAAREQARPTPVVDQEGVEPLIAAYGALWRITTSGATIHTARRSILEQIGGQGSDAQRKAVKWAAKNIAPVTADELLREGDVITFEINPDGSDTIVSHSRAQPTTLRIGEGEDQGADSGSPTSRRGSHITDASALADRLERIVLHDGASTQDGADIDQAAQIIRGLA